MLQATLVHHPVQGPLLRHAGTAPAIPRPCRLKHATVSHVERYFTTTALVRCQSTRAGAARRVGQRRRMECATSS